MNILICDDMQSEAEYLEERITEEGHSAAVFSVGADALEYIEDGGFADAAILDIMMPGMNGVELAARLRKTGWNGRIVFLSASGGFGPESYRVKAFDYLLKPITPIGIKDILKKLVDADKDADTKSVPLKAGGIIRTVLYRDISHVEAINHSVVYHLTDASKMEVYGAIADVEALLSADGRFARCHRSFIVNFNEIKSIAGYEIVMRTGARIKISQSYAGVKRLYFERGLREAHR